MSAAETYDLHDERFQQFLDLLKRVVEITVVPTNIFLIYINLVHLICACSKIRSRISKAIDKCKPKCESVYQCTTDFCGTAKKFRDGLIAVNVRLEDSALSPMFAPLRWSIEKQIDQWDDFVVDCEISLDKDIHSIIEKIADAA